MDKSSTLYVGLDVHNDSIDIAAAEAARDANEAISTFDMSAAPKAAQWALDRPLEGVVR